MLRTFSLAVLFAALAACSAQDPKIAANGGWAHETGQSDTAAAYVTIKNEGSADRLTGASIQIDRGHLLEARQCEASLCAFSAEGVPDLEQALRLGRVALLRVTRADRPALEFELSLSGVSAALDRVASARQARRP